VKNHLIALLVITPLLLSSQASTSHATAKAGAKCSKVGSKSVVGTKTFTCIQSGKKMIWDKGVTSKPLSNNPGFGPAGRIEYRFVDGKLQRKNADGLWRFDDSRNTKEFDLIRVAAFESIWNQAASKSVPKIFVTNHISASYPPPLAQAIQIGITNFIDVVSPYLKRDLNMDLVLVTEKDKSFIDTELPSIINKNYYTGNLNILNEYTSKESFYRRGGAGGGKAGFGDPENKGYYLGNTASFAEMETYWPQVAPHEMAHAVQFFLARGFVNNCGEGAECGKWHGHLIEGSANAVGMAIAFPVLGWYSDEMDKILKFDIRNFGPSISMKNEDDAVAIFKRIETRTSELNDSLSYSAGQVLWEYYIGTYGFQKWIELYSNLPKTANFNENLKTTIGIDKATFYQNAAPYFLSVWKRLS